MPLFFLYIIKLSIGLALAWLFYQLFLRRLTFYNWNRWYLLGYAVLCFFIPLIDARKVVNKIVDVDRFAAPSIVRYLPALPPAPRDHVWDILFFILALGSLILLIRLAGGWLSLRKLRRQASLITDTAISTVANRDRVKIYQVKEQIVPFSFGNAIYINQSLHSEKEVEEIILHEWIHIRQRHSMDILLAELLCITCWYNPFAWLIRHSVRQNLEFIADSKVLEKGFDRKRYQYHLLKVIGEPRYRLANNFNFSSLKKRIVMMNKIRSARLQLVKFLFVLPLLAFLLVAFRDQYRANIGQKPVLRQIKKAIFAPSTQVIVIGEKDSVPKIPESNGKEAANPAAPVAAPAIVPPVQPAIPPSPAVAGTHAAFTDALCIVDGVELSEKDMKNIDPKDIASIDVLKGPNTVPYGERGKNGVLLITTKKGAGRKGNAPISSPGTIEIRKDTILVTDQKISKDSLILIADARKDSVMVTISGETVNVHPGSAHSPQPESLRVADTFKGLIMLDGREISGAELRSLDSRKIKSYSIIQGDEAAKQYGEKGRQGALVISTK